MNPKFFIELFGYMGTALVIISMLMTSVIKLRIFNICGSFIGMLYGIATNTWPNVILNLSLITINVYQLLRIRFSRFKFSHVKTDASDKNLAYFKFLYSDDILKFYPDYNFHMNEDDEAHLVYKDSEVVGILIGHRDGDTLNIQIDYVTPKYRDMSISKYLYSRLKSSGISTLISSGNSDYLIKAGFVNVGGQMQKSLINKGEKQ